MNNLKKVLALGLALVMLLGMFTIASAAKDTNKMVASDLSDWASVEHKDAVALMVDLGIINGKDDGSFDPTGNIDRASWAKMVYFAATGSADADAYLGTATTLNDIAGNWAESYISYLSSNKYISGDNFGNYNPSNNVTVAEANKMMLTVLGYDAEDRGYQNNAAWSGNIMTDAKRNGLMENVDRDQTALVPLTRENAAEIVYNALQANTVRASAQWDGGVRHVETYNKVSTLGYDVFGIIRVEATVSDVVDGCAVFSGDVLNVDGNKLPNVKANQLKDIKASTDVKGETVSVFVEVTGLSIANALTGEQSTGVSFVKVVSSSVARGATTADVVYMDGFRWANINNVNRDEYVGEWAYTDGDSSKAMLTNFYFNGDLLGRGTEGLTAFEKKIAVNSTGDKIWDSSNSEGIPGIIVEFYLDENADISMVKGYEYSVAQLDGDVETRTSNNELQVKVPGIVTSWVAADKVTGYNGLAENDVVLYYRSGANKDNYTWTIEKAEKVTGKITTINSSGRITVNGTKYQISGVADTTNTLGWDRNNVSTWTDRENEFDFYLDQTGAIVFIEKLTDAATRENVALVMAAEWTGIDMATTSGKLEAKLLFVDGTTQIVTVSKLNDLRIVTANTFENTSNTSNMIVGGADDGVKATTGAAGTAIKALADSKLSKFYTYRVVDGAYQLTEIVKEDTRTGWTDTVAAAEKVDVKQQTMFAWQAGATTATRASGMTMNADNSTVFVVAKSDINGNEEYYTYTGFKNVPEMAGATKVLAVGTNDNAGIAKYVFVTTDNYSSDVPEGYIFIYNKGWDEDSANEDCYLINVVDVNGDVTQMSVTAEVLADIQKDSTSSVKAWANNSYVGSFCRIDRIDDKGVISALTPVAIYGDSDFGNLTAIGNGVVAVDDASYDYDNLTKFVYVDLVVNDGDFEEATDDTLEFAAADTFRPDGFLKANTVNPGAAEAGTTKVSDATYAYDSINAVVIAAPNSTTLNYVYVLRVVW
ncbi:MAG: S-layer homology domain-containing protein [Muribaculaceae bacterium]|nr:S-layer homology domain-containing protein [Muribaculaceae bacterium]